MTWGSATLLTDEVTIGGHERSAEETWEEVRARYMNEKKPIKPRDENSTFSLRKTFLRWDREDLPDATKAFDYVIKSSKNIMFIRFENMR
jgi:hypothetical protein